MVISKDINEIHSVIIAQLTVEKNKTKIPVVKIDRNFYEETGTRIPFAKLGFPNLINYLETVPGVEVIKLDNVHYVNFVGAESSYHIFDFVTNHRYTYPPSTARNSGKITSSTDSHGSSKKTSKDIQEYILFVVKNYPNGLSKINLLKQLNYGYGLKENHHNLGKHLKALHKLVTIKSGLIYENTRQDTKPSASVSVSSNKQLCSDDIVMSTRPVYETVGQILVSDLKINNNNDENRTPLIEVEVVEVYSPSFFWIQLLKNQKQFNKMMATLGEFYQVNYQDYEVPIIMLEQGLHVACVFAGKWHRAILKNVNSNHKVTVMFYDYGTIEKYSPNEVFYLHKSFKTLPAQAVPCRLYGVAPYNSDKWPKGIRDCFSKWVWEKPLYANIVEVNVERNSMSVILIDTSGEDDFFMNDWLITNKMAKVKKMDCVNPEDMSLYVDDFCEYYADGDGVEAIIPTTRHPESNGRLNVPIDQSAKNNGSLNNELDLYKYDWEALKSQVRKKIDEHIILTMKLYHDFMINDMGSMAHEIIQNVIGDSLTDSMIEVIFSLLDLDLQTIFVEVTNTPAVSNGLNTEQNINLNTVGSEQVPFTFKLTERLLPFVEVSKSVPVEIEKVQKCNKLNTSIEKATNTFFENRNIIDLQNIMDENVNVLAESFLDTNPFKKDLFMDNVPKKNTTEPSPLPSKPFNFKSTTQTNSVINVF